jgi:2-polyprenyl-3-methyl-5-hydroxy-6-metoxy-1,4-benzoquinol methylase
MFDIAPDYQTAERMELKQRAIPWPDFTGKRVLDCGTDFGNWTFYAARHGARDVLGLDRNRAVRGFGPVDLIEMNRERAVNMGLSQCRFERINMGKEWREFGQFDAVLVMSVYHHILESAGGDHAAVWFWLSRHCAPGGVLIWEGPVDDSDPVVRANVSKESQAGFTQKNILAAAGKWFDAEFIGPALHEPTREVWRFTRKETKGFAYIAHAVAGAGGATPAFKYAGERRMGEIETALGARPLPGSLNLRLERDFRWGENYYRAQILDVANRGAGLNSEWAQRWARFYPVEIEGQSAWAMRFEGEKYPANFVELVAPTYLRSALPPRALTLFQN